MSIVTSREVLPRTFSHRFGEAPSAERKFVVTVTQPVPHQTILNFIRIAHGSPHPEYAYLFCVEGSLTEPDPYHVEVTFRYELPQSGGPEDGKKFASSPLARPDVWSFSAGGAQIPATRHYDGNGNYNVKPLVNGAGDLFEGVTGLEAEIRATISWNRATFPKNLASVANCVNDAPWLWGARHTWFCQGISASAQSEVVNGTLVNYWSGSTELVYRASSHNLYLPHVGWNYLRTAGDYSASSKTRQYVVFKNSDGTDEQVPASTPQPLNADGTRKEGEPDILVRRIYPEITFSYYFGTPPF